MPKYQHLITVVHTVPKMVLTKAKQLSLNCVVTCQDLYKPRNNYINTSQFTRGNFNGVTMLWRQIHLMEEAT